MKLKRVVIKEELVALTGDAIAAIILNQFLYWSERVRDFDSFIEEERERGEDPNVAPTKGWIYKSKSELGEEIMLDVSETTIRRRLDDLVEAGYLERRASPNKWDRTLQYRPHIYNIQRALFGIGYVLDGYPLQFQFESSDDDTGSSPSGGSTGRCDRPNGHSDRSREHGDRSSEHGDRSKEHNDRSREQSDRSSDRGDGTIPEITSETTTENTNKNNNRHPPPRDTPPARAAPSGGDVVVAVADLSESERRAFEALRVVGFEPERLALEYATKAPESAHRWAIYARDRRLGAGYVRKHLDEGDQAPDPTHLGPALSPPPPAGKVYR